MNNLPKRDAELFPELLQVPFDQRDAYLARVCGDDDALRQRLRKLLEANDELGDFLDKPFHKLSGQPRSVPSIGEKPGDLIGRYKLLEQIGEGGCGVVFMAEQREPVRRQVAVKIIKPGMDTKSVIARFEAERQALALMNHPNIAKVFDAGATESGRPYFVMELVRGIKITEYCDQNSLSTEERLGLFIQVCEAIQHAHQKGIIHRDIKPSNILVTIASAGEPLPVVIDFGIAKATNNQELTDKTVFTAFEMLIGTPAYMSPEQANFGSADIDTRTDIYSLGVLLYELLTGSTPLESEELPKAGLDAIRRTILEKEPVQPSTRLRTMREAGLNTLAQHHRIDAPALVRKIRGDLDWIVMKSIEKDRTRRYVTANSLSRDIQHFLANEPVSARPPSSLYKFQKTVSRNKFLFLGIGLATMLLVVCLIVVSVLLEKERQARRLTDAALRQAQREGLKSREVSQFLEDMLQDVGPSVARGRDTTLLREILDRTATRIGGELTNQPAVEAELDSLIGQLYFQVGSYEKAEKMDRSAIAIDRKLYSEDNAGLAATLDELGLALDSQGKPSEAEQVESEGLAIRRRLFNEENTNVATSLNDLAHAEIDSGKIAEAQKITLESLQIRQKLLGTNSLEAADSLRNLTLILGDEEKWAQSEATARKVLEIRQKKLGSEHPWVASALGDLAWVVGSEGKKTEAQALEDEVLTIRQYALPEGDPDIAASLYLVGDRLRQRGELDEATAILNVALSMQYKALGTNSPSTLYTLKSLGLVYKAESNWPEAETEFREVLSVWRERLGNNEPTTLFAIRDLEEALDHQGKLPEAEALNREALAAWLKRAGDTNSETLYTLHRLGATLNEQRKFGEAETVYREQLAGWEKRTGNDDPQTLFALRELGITLGYAGKWEQAESVHREALAAWRKRVGNDDPQTLYTLDWLGWTLEGQSKWSQAEGVYRETLQSRRKQAGNGDPQTLSEYDRLTGVLMQQKKFAETEQLLAEALTPAVIKQPTSCNLLSRRLELMGRQGRWQEAAAAAALVVQYQPTDPYRWHTLAALLAITRNRPAYEKLCAKMVATFSDASNPYTDERVSKDCLFLPDSGVDLKVVDKLAAKAVSGGNGWQDLAYFQVAKAMSDYRLGHFTNAIEWSQKTLNSTNIYPNAHAYAIMAMSYWKLGQKDVARTMLDRGDSLTPEILHSPEPVDLGQPWMAWLEARISLDEADALIQPLETQASSQKP